KDVLDFSKLESGTAALSIDEVDVEELVASGVETVRPIAAKQGIRLETLHSNPGSKIRVDRVKCTQVLINLLSNSLKFTNGNGVVTVATEVDQTMVHISVKDTGIGIPPEQQEAIFEPFRQVDASYTRRFGGTGLGLSIANALVTLHGGDISVDST